MFCIMVGKKPRHMEQGGEASCSERKEVGEGWEMEQGGEGLSFRERVPKEEHLMGRGGKSHHSPYALPCCSLWPALDQSAHRSGHKAAPLLLHFDFPDNIGGLAWA